MFKKPELAAAVDDIMVVFAGGEPSTFMILMDLIRAAEQTMDNEKSRLIISAIFDLSHIIRAIRLKVKTKKVTNDKGTTRQKSPSDTRQPGEKEPEEQYDPGCRG